MTRVYNPSKWNGFKYCSAIIIIGIFRSSWVAASRPKDLAMVACRRIGFEFGAERVILFGSYARGEVTEDSDVDLLVIGSFEGGSVDKSVEIRLKLRPKFPLDLLVRTPEKVRHRIEIGDSFMKEVLEEGKLLYEANDRRMDYQS